MTQRGLPKQQAAQYIGIPVATFERCVQNGEIERPIQIGRCRVWDIKALDAFFDRYLKSSNSADVDSILKGFNP